MLSDHGGMCFLVSTRVHMARKYYLCFYIMNMCLKSTNVINMVPPFMAEKHQKIQNFYKFPCQPVNFHFLSYLPLLIITNKLVG